MLDVATNVINKTNRSEFYSPPRRQYQQITQEYDPSLKALWTYMTPVSIPCFNQNLVEEIHHSFHVLDEKKGHFQKEDNWYPVNYSVIASRHPKVFNLGGDLALFISLIREKNKAALMHYARLCVEALYVRLINFNSTVITISVVQGDALGGGFEFALSSNIIIAEQGTRLGFPEILFSMFPGMGAYSFLLRKVGMRITEDLITSGNTYKAEDLYKLGVIDFVAPTGEGKNLANDLMRKQERQAAALKNIYQCRQLVNPITHAELHQVITLWVDAAMMISEKDLTTMRRLLNSQRYQQDIPSSPKSVERSHASDLVAA